MALFNAFQLVLLFACGPFIINYVHDASFTAHSVLFYVLVVAYLIGFGALIASTADRLEK